jgi:hypothetical protein
VTDNFPTGFSAVSWTCAPAANCGATSGTGNINTTVNLANNADATFTINATVAANASGALVNTTNIAAPATAIDSNPANNSATDTDNVIGTVTLPALGTALDTFTRANANTLGSNWSQATFLGAAAIQVNNNQAFCSNTGILPPCGLGGLAVWNGTTGGGPTYGAEQGAAFQFASTPANGASLLLKVTNGGGTATNPANYIRVRYTGSQIIVETTTNANNLIPTYVLRATFPATFATNDTLSAAAYSDGTVNVYKTSGATTTAIGSVTIPTSGADAWTQGASGGRIGMQLPSGQRVDNFSGGTVAAATPPPAAALGAIFPQATLLADNTATDDTATDDTATDGAGYSIFLPVVANQ